MWIFADFGKILVVFGKLPTIDFSAYELPSEITQIERVAEIHVPDIESTRSGLYKFIKEYSQRVAVAVVV